MLNEEEEKAIERLEKRIKDNEDYKTTQVWLTDDVVAVNRVLNLITKLQKENEEKDKQIDVMADSFAEEGFYSEHCQTLIDNELCTDDCNKCVKQYFEKLSKEKA